jgi:hypothetical protein
MPFKMKPFFLLLLAFPCVAIATDKGGKPTSEPIARYQAMIERSPFALASESAPAPAAADNAGFTKDLVLTGAVRLSSSEYISIASRDQAQRFALQTGETYNGISLVSVAWSGDVGKTRATLKRGTEYGTVSFDEAAMHAGVGAPPQPGAPQPPGNGQQPIPPNTNPSQGLAPGQNPGSPITRRRSPIRANPVPP